MPVKCKDIKNLLVEEKTCKTCQGSGEIETIFSDTDECPHCCFSHQWNQCRTEQGNRMVGLLRNQLELIIDRELKKYPEIITAKPKISPHIMIAQALIDAESELIVGKNNVSDDDLCHGQDKFIPDNSTQNTL